MRHFPGSDSLLSKRRRSLSIVLPAASTAANNIRIPVYRNKPDLLLTGRSGFCAYHFLMRSQLKENNHRLWILGTFLKMQRNRSAPTSSGILSSKSASTAFLNISPFLPLNRIHTGRSGTFFSQKSVCKTRPSCLCHRRRPDRQQRFRPHHSKGQKQQPPCDRRKHSLSSESIRCCEQFSRPVPKRIALPFQYRTSYPSFRYAL